MSRHTNIAQELHHLQEMNVIEAWSKDHDPANPHRIHWVVSLDRLTTRRWTTSEAEAFIEGVRRHVLAGSTYA